MHLLELLSRLIVSRSLLILQWYTPQPHTQTQTREQSYTLPYVMTNNVPCCVCTSIIVQVGIPAIYCCILQCSYTLPYVMTDNVPCCVCTLIIIQAGVPAVYSCILQCSQYLPLVSILQLLILKQTFCTVNLEIFVVKIFLQSVAATKFNLTKISVHYSC